MRTHKCKTSFELIYNNTYHDLLKYIIVHCKNFDDVNDIIQEIYIQLFKIMQRKDIEDIKPFIFGIAKNKLKKYQSNLSKEKKLFINEYLDDEKIANLVSDSYILEDQVLNKLTEEEIWTYLECKKSIIFKIFYLYYAEDFTLKKIAEELEINESTVKNNLYRTLKELDTIFGKENDNNE